MQEALAEARKGFGSTSPNPAVGAVLVDNSNILARGYHRYAGGPHAEVDCLDKIKGSLPKSAVLYVTLEPCSTYGRTPPCVRFLAERGVRRVVVGTLDPNPNHHGHGVEQLRAEGVEVEVGVLEAECAQLNEAYNKWIVTQQPYVIAKCGMSLDGRLTRPPSESRWLTSPASRAHARLLRMGVDAILVGAETLRRDNPRLTTGGRSRSKQPWRVIVTRSGRLPPEAVVFRDRHREATLIYRDKVLRSVLTDLGKRKVTSVLIEGGGQVLSDALDQRLIDKFHIYLAPIFTGGRVLAFAGRGAGTTIEALPLGSATYTRIGHDVLITGYAIRN